MKSYTDLEQSKTLSKILPIESADMFYNEEPDETYPKDILDTKYPMVIRKGQKHYLDEYGIPCWSLAALLHVLPRINCLKPVLDLEECSIQYSGIDLYITASNLVDACYEMILMLQEQNLI